MSTVIIVGIGVSIRAKLIVIPYDLPGKVSIHHFTRMNDEKLNILSEKKVIRDNNHAPSYMAILYNTPSKIKTRCEL
jgi:hypothetical protein